MAAVPTLRSLAIETGYALATVSRALRDDPMIRKSTRLKIQGAAATAGYRPNARISAAMRQLRRPVAKRSFDALAWLEWPYPASYRVRDDYLRIMREAAERRAVKLGWTLERFSLADARVPQRSLGRILHSRGIRAAVLAPLHRKMECIGVDFSRLAAVAIGYSLGGPGLCRVARATIDSMSGLAGELARRGYVRPGFAQSEWEQLKTHRLPWAGFQILREDFAVENRLPALSYESLKELPRWLKRHRPDVVIGDQAGILEVLRKEGLRVPEDVGFVLTTRTPLDEGIAGLDPNYGRLAECAVDFAIQKAQQEEYGCSAEPRVVLVGSTWFDGGTLRADGEKNSGGSVPVRRGFRGRGNVAG